MPCSLSPFSVFLQVQKTDRPCTGLSSFLNLRLWHHALVTSTIPTLIKKPLCGCGSWDLHLRCCHSRHKLQTVTEGQNLQRYPVHFIRSFFMQISDTYKWPAPLTRPLFQQFIDLRFWPSGCTLLPLFSFWMSAFSSCLSMWTKIPHGWVIYPCSLFLLQVCLPFVPPLH